MNTGIKHVPLERLVPHADNPNRMSRGNLAKLARNIERSGHYEPLVVRPCPGRPGCYQIINGHHRCEALRTLGHQTADVVVWDVDDEQTDILLVTLNRLSGRDSLDKKLALLRRLNARIPTRKLARLLLHTVGQIERLTASKPLAGTMRPRPAAFAVPVVFFVDEAQKALIEEALSQAGPAPEGGTKAARRVSALMQIVRGFLGRKESGSAGPVPPGSR